MLLGPVFQTELVANARRRRYYLLRVLFAGMLLFSLWMCYEGVAGWYGNDRLSIREAANLASGFFVTFAWLSMILTLLVAPAVAAGAIATERERRTIEYLFATDLSNAEIVLSKLFGKLLLVGKLVMVALPVLAIFRLMGGIPGSLLLTYFAMLASTATLVTVGSMCISVWSPRARDALIRVYLVEALVFLLPFFLGSWMMALGMQGGVLGTILTLFGYVVDWCLAINPLPVMFSQMIGSGLGMGYGASEVWQLVGWQLLLSLVLCCIAVIAVRRVHLRSVSSAGATTRSWKWELPRIRLPLGEHPMLWKELFARTSATKLGFLGRVCMGIIMLGTLSIAIYQYAVAVGVVRGGWGGSPGNQYIAVSMSISTLIGVGGVILMGLRAASLITNEKEHDSWLSLISTPLTGSDIILAKALGNFYAFRWLAAPLALVWFLQLTLSPEFMLAIPFHVLAVLTTGLFATSVGLAYSLKFKGSLRSIGATIGTLFFFGGGYMMCCCMPLLVTGGDDEIMKLALVLFVPFLHFAPGMIMIEGVHGEEWVVVDMILGLMIYAAAGIMILATLVSRFDELVGRTFRPEYAAPLRPQAPGEGMPSNMPPLPPRTSKVLPLLDPPQEPAPDTPQDDTTH
ncbi:ABC transporter permease subunit [Aeoliella mucimassa]|uniref:ABC-2 family transporter protein n=1 Tax=Aeoliella mucimassa TaxID=2527972 RepID=A0A518AL07_9BACT|nr:ABC transporter permease subunit [Aeoliella mucimassa]QDU55391.1 ABC-2 family transporter protein [Aeoliella mucimassa]